MRTAVAAKPAVIPVATALPDFLTVEEVALALRTTVSTVHYWKGIGRLKGVRVGRRRLYDKREIQALLDKAVSDEAQP
jgi:excisionase family DNA binding protein